MRIIPIFKLSVDDLFTVQQTHGGVKCNNMLKEGQPISLTITKQIIAKLVKNLTNLSNIIFVTNIPDQSFFGSSMLIFKYMYLISYNFDVLT